MENDMKLIYDNIILLQDDIKSMKKDINNVIEELNVKIARLETQMDIVLDNKANYDDLNNKVQIMNAKINELTSDKESNKGLKQGILIGIIVFIASYCFPIIVNLLATKG